MPRSASVAARCGPTPRRYCTELLSVMAIVTERCRCILLQHPYTTGPGISDRPGGGYMAARREWAHSPLPNSEPLTEFGDRLHGGSSALYCNRSPSSLAG